MHDVCGEIKASSKSNEFLAKELPKLNYKIIFKYFYSHRNACKVGAYVHFFDCGEKENKKTCNIKCITLTISRGTAQYC